MNVRTADVLIPSSRQFRSTLETPEVRVPNFPLSEIHPHAETAAEVAEFAGAQGKFLEMRDRLCENRSIHHRIA